VWSPIVRREGAARSAPYRGVRAEARGINLPVYQAIMVLIVAVLLAPLLLSQYLPFVDYPNHLARAHIRGNYNRVPLYQQQYEIYQVPAPYLAMDLILAPLTRVMSLTAAAKVFVAVLVLVYCLGCHLLATTLNGRPTWAVPVACLWLYNSNTLWGFLNYSLGVAVFLVTLAFWLRWRLNWTPMRFAGMVALSIACYLGHFTSYVFLGIVIATVCGHDLRIRSNTLAQAARSIVPALAPLPLYAIWKVLIAYQEMAPAAPGTKLVVWSTLFGKIGTGPATLIRTYHFRLDAVLVCGWAAIGICLWHTARSHGFRVSRALALAGALLLALYALLPNGVAARDDGIASADGISRLDGRFVLPGLLLLLLSTTVLAGRRRTGALVIASLVLSVVRLGALESDWRDLSREIAEATTLFPLLPEGAKVFAAFLPGNGPDQGKRGMALAHVLCYAIPQRHILDVRFFETGRMVVFRDRNLSNREPLWLPKWGWRFFHDFDYVWSYGEPRELLDLLRIHGTRLATHAGFSVWRLRHESDEPATFPLK
jgi:hypothetical protein